MSFHWYKLIFNNHYLIFHYRHVEFQSIKVSIKCHMFDTLNHKSKDTKKTRTLKKCGDLSCMSFQKLPLIKTCLYFMSQIVCNSICETFEKVLNWIKQSINIFCIVHNTSTFLTRLMTQKQSFENRWKTKNTLVLIQM